jgi:hypothetical protein
MSFWPPVPRTSGSPREDENDSGTGLWERCDTPDLVDRGP